MRSIIAQGGSPDGQALRPLRAGLISRVLALSLPRFLAVGCLGLITDAITFWNLSALGAPDWAARTLSICAATLVTWQLNRRFTFAASGRRTHAEALRYAAVAFAAQGFNLALFLAFRHAAPGLPAMAALVLSSCSAAGFSFAGQCLVTFRARLVGTAPVSLGVRS